LPDLRVEGGKMGGKRTCKGEGVVASKNNQSREMEKGRVLNIGFSTEHST